mmetsp:Transcript_50185/g.90153  ORF Transcript_50185/g.90153 Transcript_50185/m.90153 type:complete len:333 (-) Transcript_50185:949-1947(-)
MILLVTVNGIRRLVHTFHGELDLLRVAPREIASWQLQANFDLLTRGRGLFELCRKHSGVEHANSLVLAIRRHDLNHRSLLDQFQYGAIQPGFLRNTFKGLVVDLGLRQRIWPLQAPGPACEVHVLCVCSVLNLQHPDVHGISKLKVILGAPAFRTLLPSQEGRPVHSDENKYSLKLTLGLNGLHGSRDSLSYLDRLDIWLILHAYGDKTLGDLGDPNLDHGASDGGRIGKTRSKIFLGKRSKGDLAGIGRIGNRQNRIVKGEADNESVDLRVRRYAVESRAVDTDGLPLGPEKVSGKHSHRERIKFQHTDIDLCLHFRGLDRKSITNLLSRQ